MAFWLAVHSGYLYLVCANEKLANIFRLCVCDGALLCSSSFCDWRGRVVLREFPRDCACCPEAASVAREYPRGRHCSIIPFRIDKYIRVLFLKL